MTAMCLCRHAMKVMFTYYSLIHSNAQQNVISTVTLGPDLVQGYPGHSTDVNKSSHMVRDPF